jgi:hypothetical protein
MARGWLSTTNQPGHAASRRSPPLSATFAHDLWLSTACLTYFVHRLPQLRKPIHREPCNSAHLVAIPDVVACGSQPYAVSVLDLSNVDVDEIANALSDQTDYEHRWLIDPRTGEIAFWTADTGINGQDPVELDELDLTPIEPLPSYVWYQDMADFAEAVSDEGAGRRLARAIDGKGAFRRFKRELYEEYPELVSVWQAFRDTRAKRRAVEWLRGEGLIDDDVAEQFLGDNPDPDVR